MNEKALPLVKARLGITATVRDAYLTAIIDGVISELEQVQGLSLDSDDPFLLMFVVDLSTWRYENKGQMDGMPRHLQFRLHNLIINGVRK